MILDVSKVHIIVRITKYELELIFCFFGDKSIEKIKNEVRFFILYKRKLIFLLEDFAPRR